MNDFIDAFIKHYNRKPVAAAQAPGRLEVLGNHTDYNEGIVLSCAVEQNTKFALHPVTGTRCRIWDFRDNVEMTFDLNDKTIPKDGGKYILGVVRELQNRNYEIPAFNAAIFSTVPLSAGMSSSAALEVAAGLAIGMACNINLPSAEWAKIGQGVENNFLGLKTGLLDQFSSLFGQADQIIESDFRAVSVIRTVPVPPGYCFAVINSMKKHNLVSSAYNERRQDCENAMKILKKYFPNANALRDINPDELASARPYLDWREYRRASHIVTECARVSAGIRLLDEKDVRGFGGLLFDSHESSRMNFENSTPELDYLIDLAKNSSECFGARLSGGGFGGITIHLVKRDKADNYVKKICSAYQKHTGIKAESFICSLGEGATVWR